MITLIIKSFVVVIVFSVIVTLGFIFIASNFNNISSAYHTAGNAVSGVVHAFDVVSNVVSTIVSKVG